MVTPMIAFAGNCRAALEFYGAAFGAVPTAVFPYGEYVPEGTVNVPENLSEWLMHAELDICGTVFWFADEVLEPSVAGSMVKLTAKVPNAVVARAIFDALSDGGRVTLPPTEAFYTTFHAGVVDRFGVPWSIVAEEAPGRG